MEEKKSKRGNILFTPKVYRDMQTLADADGTSLNDYLHELALIETERRRELIDAKDDLLALKNKMISSLGNITIEEQQETIRKMNALQSKINALSKKPHE